MEENKKIKVVCMGDSITEGFGVLPEESYPSRLQKYLGEGYEVYNQGVCSSTVLNIPLEGRPMGLPYARQDKYQEALTIQGDIYLILLGTNDAQDGLGDVEDVTDPYLNMISQKEEFVSHYQAILDRITEVAPEARIYLGIPVPVMQCIWRRHQEKYLQMLLPYLKQIQKQNPKIGIFDPRQAYLELPKEEMAALYQDDGLHPGASGVDLIARTAFEAIRS